MELEVLAEVRLLDRGIVDQLELFFFHGGAETLAEKNIPKLGLDVRGVTLADHVERSPTWAKPGETSRFLKREQDLFLFFADVVAGDFSLHAAAATPGVFQ